MDIFFYLRYISLFLYAVEVVYGVVFVSSPLLYIYYYCLPFSDKHVENKKTNEFRFYPTITWENFGNSRSVLTSVYKTSEWQRMVPSKS